MRPDRYDLDVKSAAGGVNGDGDAKVSGSLRGMAVEIKGTFTATLQVQGSFDGGTTWHNVGLSKTAADYVDIGEVPFSHIRIKTTAYTNGTPEATLNGWNSRTH